MYPAFLYQIKVDFVSIQYYSLSIIIFMLLLIYGFSPFRSLCIAKISYFSID